MGDYIAAAVLSIAFDQVVPVVDGNVKRVLSRLLEIDTPVNRSGAHNIFQGPAGLFPLPETSGRLQPGHHGTGCADLPPEASRLPVRCPLSSLCLANLHDKTADYPKRDAVPKNSPSASGHRRDPEEG